MEQPGIERNSIHVSTRRKGCLDQQVLVQETVDGTHRHAVFNLGDTQLKVSACWICWIGSRRDVEVFPRPSEPPDVLSSECRDQRWILRQPAQPAVNFNFGQLNPPADAAGDPVVVGRIPLANREITPIGR